MIRILKNVSNIQMSIIGTPKYDDFGVYALSLDSLKSHSAIHEYFADLAGWYVQQCGLCIRLLPSL